MVAYLIRRFVLMLLTLFGISVIIFGLLRIVPGDVVDILFDQAGMIDPAGKLQIEKDLGLDKLGVSLEDVINSARDPEQDDKVTEALKKQAGMVDEKEEDADKAVLLKQDEDGTYAPTDAAPQN